MAAKRTFPKKTSKAKTVSKDKSKRKSKPKASKTSSRKSDSILNALSADIWPIERDLFFRPDRFKYVRKIIKPEGCVFCKSAQVGIGFESLCVFTSELSMVVLNKFPYNSGHLLVLPKRHCGDFLQLKADEYKDLSETLRLAVSVVQETYQCQGFNIGLNHGSVAGAGIPDHLHWHLVPRWSGDLNFFPLIAETKTVIETLEQSYEKLKRGFSEKRSQ